MTSKERADAVIASIEKKIPAGLPELLRVHIVQKEQNGPPDGPGDGTLTEAQWCAMRNLARYLGASLRAVEQYKAGIMPTECYYCTLPVEQCSCVPF